MKQLSGSRGWEHAYKKEVEHKLAGLRAMLEHPSHERTLGEFQFLCGKIRGISEAIDLLDETLGKYRLDDDADLAS